MAATRFYLTGDEPILFEGREVQPGGELPGCTPEVGERLVDEGRASTSKPKGDPAPADDADGDQVDYSKLRKPELEALVADRGLDATGTADELRTALAADDADGD